jgi:cytochrome c biogenesis protein CcmG/thiol:disulfide interchange protein DsbE
LEQIRGTLGNRLIFIIGAALVVAASFYFASRNVADPPSFGVSSGQQLPAPQMKLTDLNGQKVDLASYKGQVVLVDFWATWCDPCRAEIPHFIQLQDKYRDQGLQIIGISMDDGPKPVREFSQEFKMNYPVAMGNAKLAERFGGVLGLPVSFLIGRDGRIYARHVGETDATIFESEIKQLLARPAAAPSPAS